MTKNASNRSGSAAARRGCVARTRHGRARRSGRRVHPEGAPGRAHARGVGARVHPREPGARDFRARRDEPALYKILENMELGHNVMHGQYDFLADPSLDSKTYEWDLVGTAEDLEKGAQRHPSHLHQRARQGRRLRLRVLPALERPGVEAEPPRSARAEPARGARVRPRGVLLPRASLRIPHGRKRHAGAPHPGARDARRLGARSPAKARPSTRRSTCSIRRSRGLSRRKSRSATCWRTRCATSGRTR